MNYYDAMYDIKQLCFKQQVVNLKQQVVNLKQAENFKQQVVNLALLC